MWRASGLRALSCLVALAFIGLWQAAASAQLISPIYLPGPDQVFRALIDGVENGALLDQTFGTIERMIYGWLIASFIGILIGSLIGVSKGARDYLQPMLEFLRPLPASALIPLAIALLGLSDAMVLSVVGFAALWPTLLATIHGFSSVEPRLYEVSAALGLRRLDVVRKIALPNALPDIMTGMRLSLNYALILTVVGEMLGGGSGLGYWILEASRSFRAPNLYAGVALLGAIGYASAALLSVAERHLLRWRLEGK